jgi:hypothetical protein
MHSPKKDEYGRYTDDKERTSYSEIAARVSEESIDYHIRINYEISKYLSSHSAARKAAFFVGIEGFLISKCNKSSIEGFLSIKSIRLLSN